MATQALIGCALGLLFILIAWRSWEARVSLIGAAAPGGD